MNTEIVTTLISVGASCVISIIGFIITNISLKKSLKNEMRKSRDNVALEKMSSMPYEILDFWDEMIEVDIKYSGYIEKEKIIADKINFFRYN